MISSEKYTAVWNEPDETRRRAAVARLWAADAVQYTENAEHRGHDELYDRVTGAHEQFRDFTFVAGDDVVSHHDSVTFSVHMVPAAGGAAVWRGTIFLIVGDDGRIRRDYQFTGEDAGTRAVVTDFLGRLAEGDPDRIAALFADTVDWELDWPDGGHPAVPWIRPRETRADVADHFRALGAAHRPGEPGGTPPRILVEGRDAVVLGEIRQTVRATGRAYRAACALHLTVEHGLITRYHVYEDSLTVARALAG